MIATTSARISSTILSNEFRLVGIDSIKNFSKQILIGVRFFQYGARFVFIIAGVSTKHQILSTGRFKSMFTTVTD